MTGKNLIRLLLWLIVVAVAAIFIALMVVLPSPILIARAYFFGDVAVNSSMVATLEEAQQYKYRVTINGVDFNVPVTHHYNDFRRNKNRWPRIDQDEIDGKVRRTVDALRCQALLPDMEPYTIENASEYEQIGFGRRVLIYLAHRERTNWQYYFDHSFHRLKLLPVAPDLPSMFHYLDPMTNDDVYLSHSAPTPDMTRIRCNRPEPGKYPACTVTTRYMNEKFQLQYTFGLPHIALWKNIDNGVRALLDRFVRDAVKN